MNIVIALVPVLLLLLLLQLMDSFKLVRLPSVLGAIGAGGTAAGICLLLHQWLLGATSLDATTFSRYVAPVTEESVKALFIVVLLRQRRIGFLVDAAVFGFGTGAGFALIENIDYLLKLGDAPLTLWLVRGLGTAVLHGATTGMFAIVSKALFDKWTGRHALALVPGLALAIGIHSAFNHLPLPPLAMTALLLVILPLLLLWIFQRSEQATREWVGAGLDLDIELLDLVRSEHFAYTRFGSYLEELKGRFHGLVVADMFCLLRLELELSVQAKARLLAREAGLELPVTQDLHDSLAERHYLEASIGRTGLLALAPLQVTSDRDRWHEYLLATAARSARR